MQTGGFGVGDRVVAVSPVDGNSQLVGMAGTVIHISDMTPPIGVEFDEMFVGGHDCGGRGRYGYCRYGFVKSFEAEAVEIDVDPEETALFDKFLASYQK